MSEGDFLCYLADEQSVKERHIDLKNTESVLLKDVMRIDKNPPVHITANMDQLLDRAMNQNFVPVVDDVGSFVGIITRKDIIRYFADEKRAEEKKIS